MKKRANQLTNECASLMNLWVEKHLGVGSIYEKAAKNLDEPYTIVEDFSIEIYSNSSRADYKTKQVVRRYVEADRDIELATRQRSRREEAERQNIRLKLAVEHQQKLAESLSVLWRKRADVVTKECGALTSQPYLKHHVVNMLDVDGDMEDFRVLIRHLETAYRGLDAVFTANGLASSTLPPSDVHLRESVDGRYMYLECFSHKSLPFDMRATTEAIWEHFKG
ncbi:hypothetical protein PF002_g29990, partial [Phytophthora fragariae]